jgi:integrase
MPRTRRDARLETRSARLKLPDQHEPHWKQLFPRLSLGYRKGKWIVRRFDGTRYQKKTLGKADDYEDANGITVLSFKDAQQKAVAMEDRTLARYSVKDAITDYLEDYRTRSGKATYKTERAIEKHILPDLGRIELEQLTTARLRKWLNALADDGERASKVSANRYFAILLAALNLAYREGVVASDEAWRRVKPFQKADEPRVRFISKEQVAALLLACPEDFRLVAKAAVLTGCRWGELRNMRVRDFLGATVHIPDSKSGKPRDVPLNNEGQQLLSDLVAGKTDDDHIFWRSDGAPWGEFDQRDRMRSASRQAGIEPHIHFHLLRHYYGGSLAQAGVSLQVIAAALGHASTKMTERHYAHLQPSHIADVIRANLPKLGV